MASDAKLLETSHGLGTGVPRRAPAPRHRGGERELKGGVGKVTSSCRDERLDNFIIDPILGTEHDYDLKTRCYA